MKQINLLILAGLSLFLSGCVHFLFDSSKGKFDRQVDVFGVTIKATESVADEALLHAANVMAEYLDNNEDGVVDNPQVLQSMVNKQATLVMTGTQRELFFINIDSLGTEYAQDLYASETHPDGVAKRQFDATLEEVLHLISFAGYEAVYPEVFGTFPGSAMSDAMDTARGGYFKRTPWRYPKSAWYSYYDPTCDYECQGGEYFYWALTTMLGAQNYDWRKKQIANEWRLTTLEEFKQTDKAMYALLSDPQFKLPTRLPDGHYLAKSFAIEKLLAN